MSVLNQPIKKVVMGIDKNFADIKSEVVGKDLQTSDNLMFTTSNPELAAEMEQKYDGHVIVADYPVRTRPNGGTLFGGWPEMPWKKQSVDASNELVEESWPSEVSEKPQSSP